MDVYLDTEKDDRYGTIIRAFIEISSDLKSQDIYNYLIQHLSKNQCPQDIQIVDQINHDLGTTCSICAGNGGLWNYDDSDTGSFNINDGDGIPDACDVDIVLHDGPNLVSFYALPEDSGIENMLSGIIDFNQNR